MWFLPGLLLVLAVSGPLLVPGQVSTDRDLPLFHLPLRHLLVQATQAAEGLPSWNPWLHGGEPILSNPHFGVFYPPTWLALISPAYSLHLLIVLHALLALAGTWRFVRGQGLEPGAASLAAVGFAAAPWYLDLGDLLDVYSGISWLPWTLHWGLRALHGEGGTRGRSAVLAGASLALQLLAGSPLAVTISGVVLSGLVLSSPARMSRRLGTLALVFALSAGFAAVQLVPMAQRLAGSPRIAEPSAEDEDGSWSASPARLAELAFPRLFGDPHREEEGLHFGRILHDRGYPYVESLFVGLPLLVLGLAGLFDRTLPHRWGWRGILLVGVLLGLGRHSPVNELTSRIPPFAWERYPEKYLLLVPIVLVFVGAATLGRLARRPPEETRRLGFGAIGVATLLTGIAAALLAALRTGKDRARELVLRHAELPAHDPRVDDALAFLCSEAVLALGACLAVLLLLVFLRRRPRLLPFALLAVSLVQLAWYDRGLHPTLPAGEVLEPPPLARQALEAGGGRIFTQSGFERGPEIYPRVGPVGHQYFLGKRAELAPYIGVIWGLPYVFDQDYDRMFTRWSGHSRELFERIWPSPEPSLSVLAAWSVRHAFLDVSPRQRMETMRETGVLGPPARRVEVPALPPVRAVAEVETVPEETAFETLAERGFAVDERETCLGPPEPARTKGLPGELRADPLGSRITIDYEAAEEIFLVVATTFDRGWTATLEGDASAPELCPTALGQIGVFLPPGGHRLVLEYRTPGLLAGAWVTLLTLAGSVWIGRRVRAVPSR